MPHTGHIVVADFLSGQMSQDAWRDAQRHLAECAECRAAVEAAQVKQRRISARAEAAAAAEATETEEAARPAALQVLLPQFARKIWATLFLLGRFGIVAALTAGTLLLPAPEGVTPEGHRALALLVFTASMLALEPVSLPIAALSVPLAQVALGLADTRQAFTPFAHPVVFLILASLFLAEALRKHGLARRFALATIVASGGEIRLVLLALMGIAAFLSMWVENTATAAILIPVALTISRQVKDPQSARALLVLLVLGIAYAASLGGMATIMGSASNAVAAGFLTQIRPFRFVDWLIYGLPSLLLLFPLTWWLLLRIAPAPQRHLDVGPARHALNQQGRMNAAEWELLATMAVAILLWVGGEFFEVRFGLPTTLLSAALVGVAAVCYLALRNIVNWEDVKGVSWGIFLIIGAGLSLGDALIRTGVTAWMADLISPVVIGVPLLLSLLILVMLSALLTNLMSNTTIAAVFVPVLISIAAADPDFNAVQLVLPVVLATTFGYSLPSASGRMALIAASGIVTRIEMMRYGIIMTGASALVLALFFYLLAVLGWI